MNTSKMHHSYIPQIDLLKGVAIISVIIQHSVTKNQLSQTLSQFHIWQAIPIFFIVMGFTSMIYFSQKKINIRSFDWSNYLAGRYTRILIPYLIIFFISLLYGIYHNKYYFGLGYFIGLLPVSGPGAYFNSILFQYIFISPFIYFFYQKSPKYMLIALFSMDILFELIAPHISIFVNDSRFYSASIFRYFSAIALGYYISDEYIKHKSIKIMGNKNKFILIGFLISVIYLFLAIFSKQPFPLFFEQWRTQNPLGFFYPLLIIIIILNSNFQTYENKIVYNFILEIGKASYHIFLVQILFFGFKLGFTGSFAIFENLFFVLIIGWAFYYLQNNIKPMKYKERM